MENIGKEHRITATSKPSLALQDGDGQSTKGHDVKRDLSYFVHALMVSLGGTPLPHLLPDVSPWHSLPAAPRAPSVLPYLWGQQLPALPPVGRPS